MSNLKLDFLRAGNPPHKFYIYFNVTGMGGYPRSYENQNDGPFGMTTSSFNFGVILHEFGHGCFPRFPYEKKQRDKIVGEFWLAEENPIYHAVMTGESIMANFFGWYCFIAMFQAEPNHPLLKPYKGTAGLYTVSPFQSWRTMLAFDATFYVMPLWLPEIYGIQNMFKYKMGWETFHHIVNMEMMDLIEGKYDSRYATGYFTAYLYLKYGVKTNVALIYNLYRFPDLVQTICYVLGNANPPDFMLEYAIDLVLQVYTTGPLNYKDQVDLIKYPFTSTQNSPERKTKTFRNTHWNGKDTMFTMSGYFAPTPATRRLYILSLR